MADHSRVLTELCNAVAAQSGVLLLADADGALQPMATYGRPPGAAGQSQNPLGRIMRRDGDADRRLIVPVPDARGGVLVLERIGRDEFSRDDLALARLYARQMADNVVAGSPSSGTSWTRRLETLQRIGAQLTRLASIGAVGAALCSEARQVIEYDEAHVFVTVETSDDMRISTPMLRLVALSGAPIDVAGQPVPLPADGVPGHAIARALATGVPQSVPAMADAGAARPGNWSMLVVPMRVEDRINGVICVVARAPRRFDDDDRRLLQVLSEQAAVAIENARLLSAREELVAELASLLEISQASSGGADEMTLARSLATKMRNASRMDACIISRWEDNSTVLATLAQDGVDAPAGITDIADFPATWGVLRNAEPRVVQSESIDDALAEARALAEMGGRTLLMLPLTVGGKAIGLVELISLRMPRHFGPDEMKVYQTMASTAAAGLENSRLLEQLRHAADIDQVTGVHNHRYLQDRLRQEVARAARNRSPLSVLMLDLDDFKPINDRFGHADGDRVVRTVANTLKSVVRANDIVARYGGDEFVVVLPDTPADRAQEVARRVIVGIRERRHELADGSQARVGVSGGLAVYPENGRTATQLLQASDAAMYSAKRARQGKTDRLDAPEPEPTPAPTEREILRASPRDYAPVSPMPATVGALPAPSAG
jgi:diguanylate cyclase (GGDEF)-like protein